MLKIPRVYFNIMENNRTNIETIVKYSKDCITMKFTKKHLEKSLFLLKRFPAAFRVPTADSIKTILQEVEMSISERENDIKKRLVPLFENHDFSYDKIGKYSLSTDDMKSGYIFLREINGDEYVILIRPYKSNKTSFVYNPGVLYKLSVDLKFEDLIQLYDKEADSLDNYLLRLIIKKKNAYEYLE